MANTRQVISKTLILPAIGSFQYLAAVDPGLRAANGTALVPYVNTVDSDISFVINSNGTLDIYNISGKNLSAGKRIVVSAVEHLLNLPVGAEQTVTTVASTPNAPRGYFWPGIVSAQDNLTFSNTATIIPFDMSASSPLVARGFIDDPGDYGGAIRFKKPGFYTVQVNAIFSATAGGAGYIHIEPYTNTAATGTRYTQDVDFTGGILSKSLSFVTSYIFAQSAIDSGGGYRQVDFRVFTSAPTISGKLGTAASTTSRTTTATITYTGPDFFTAAP